MIYDDLKNFDMYAKLSPEAWKLVKEFIPTVNADTPKGRRQLDGDMVMADVNFYPTAPASEGRMEDHRRYVDIQVVVSGHEELYLAKCDAGELLEDGYEAKDCSFYTYVPEKSCPMSMTEGKFMVIFPGEGHMPGRGDDSCDVCKIVFKIDRTLFS